MSVQGLLARWTWQAQAGAVALGLGVTGLVETVERARSLPLSAELATIAGLRLVLLARELLPVLLAAGLAFAVGWRRHTGELAALAAAGVSAGEIRRGAALASGVFGLALAGAVELATPAARDRLAELEGERAGLSSSVAGRWVLADGIALWVGRVEGDELRDITLVPLDRSPPERRFELDSMRSDGERWSLGEPRVQAIGPGGSPDPTLPALPSAPLLLQVGGAGEPFRMGLGELELAGESRWLSLRLVGVFSGFILGLCVASLALGARAGPAACAGAAVLAMAALRAVELSAGLGAAPTLALLAPPLLLRARAAWEL